MKIRLKENEIYEIKIPEEIDTENLFILLDRLKVITKLSELSDIRKDIKTEKRKYTQNPTKTTRLYNTKEKTLDLLQYAHHGTKEDKERICKLLNMSWKEIQKRFYNLIKRYNIQPNEVGLTRWKTKYDKHSDNRIPNWTIKSHTGVFDENGNTDEENGNN